MFLFCRSSFNFFTSRKLSLATPVKRKRRSSKTTFANPAGVEPEADNADDIYFEPSKGFNWNYSVDPTGRYDPILNL